MIAQKSGPDNYCLKRIGPEALAQISEHSVGQMTFFYEYVPGLVGTRAA